MELKSHYFFYGVGIALWNFLWNWNVTGFFVELESLHGNFYMELNGTMGILMELEYPYGLFKWNWNCIMGILIWHWNWSV